MSLPPASALSSLIPSPLWYKDAIIYQLHVKAFFDSNNDGIGDFKGLLSKLDYLQSLGVNTLWLLPFYPSPLRDDGYDIADYRDVHPSYGTMDDFKTFVEAAHSRGLRVITELVINHTSDQHAWFQRARHAPAGSPERDFYVWSDTDQKYTGTRIIFTDTETSNWTWDPVANAYYWHRFFSHQPDLNFDHPQVLEEVIEAMYFWLDMGVDGLRLDAIPYLCERDGTNNENLPETHAVIKKIRAALDARYENRLLLAEANQWPEDVMQYFGEPDGHGNSDECHMAFHFPLMPRLYMALAQEDRHPIIDIMQQTPEIPANCQWATFLRNHDELTLEMVTDRERAYLWDHYSPDKQARINVGIRRRLAPLMGNDRRKIELMDALLMSMPGTPIVYYGDEIGMGDNIYLKDRDGVRTPMQWSSDRNGGFSRTDPAQLYMPAIMNPVYGFQGINVEAQAGQENSLLNWLKRLLAVVKEVPAFGRGTCTFLSPANRKVLAYVREHEGETVLCLANVSGTPQPVELDLEAFAGSVPVELLSGRPFPEIGELPYFITLSPYGFFWFRLTAAGEQVLPDMQQRELPTVILPKGMVEMDGKAREVLERLALPSFLASQRWFKSRYVMPEVIIQEIQPLSDRYGLLIVAVTSEQGETQHYTLPIGIAWESAQSNLEETLQAKVISRVRQVSQVGVLYEASGDEECIRLLMRGNEAFRYSGNVTTDTIADLPVKPIAGEQSNSAVLVGNDYLFKLLRQPQEGENLEEEFAAFLADTTFRNSPRLFGTWTDRKGVTLGLLQEAIPNQGDGWQFTLDYLEGITPATINDYAALARQLGKRTAELHQALASQPENPAFAPEKVTSENRETLVGQALQTAESAFEALQAAHASLEDETKELAETVMAQRARIETLLTLPYLITQPAIRVHGDYHLGQVLVNENDVTILDFEGEPSRSIEERRRRTLALKDVAGMLRSFDYASATALLEKTEKERQSYRPLLEKWKELANHSFLEGYGEIQPRILTFFLIEKACYEIVYESEHRPAWLSIPLAGLLELIKGE